MQWLEALSTQQPHWQHLSGCGRMCHVDTGDPLSCSVTARTHFLLYLACPKQPYLQLCWPELCSQEKGQKLSLVTQAGGMGSSLGCQAWAAASPRLPGWFSLYWQTWGSQPSKKQESHQMVSTEKLWFQVSPSAMPQQWFQRALQSQNSVTPTLPASPKQFSGLGVTVVVLMVGLDDLKSLFQPWWFYNSWPDLQL